MKRLLRIFHLATCIASFLLVNMHTSSFGQSKEDYSVSLDVVQGLQEPGVLSAGPNRLMMRYQLPETGGAVLGFSNGFRLYSAFGLDHYVLASAEFSGDLILGGSFDNAGILPAGGLVAWDGVTWHTLGAGVSGWIYTMAVSNGNLYVGGEFTEIDGVSCSNVAMWDGVEWHALGSGTNAPVRAIAAYGSHTVIGGEFTQAGGAPANYIAQWDGSSWSDLETGTNATVWCLHEHDGLLYAGGGFSIAGSAITSALAAWDGTEWTAPEGFQASSAVYDLETYATELVVAGTFTTVGEDIAISYIASWDGTAWTSLASGTNSTVMTLAVHDGNLIAGGAFTSADGNTANHIASWNGTAWSALATGFDDVCYSCISYSGALIAGGIFTSADGNSDASYVASWHGSNWSSIDQPATWTTVKIDTTSLAWYPDMFNLGFTFEEHSVTGSGADTLMVSAVGVVGGIPPGFDELSVYIDIELDQSQQGRAICLDSCFVPPAGLWMWMFDGGTSVFPTWSGPHCFTVGGCQSGADTDADGWVDDCDYCPDDPDNDIDADTHCADVDNCAGTFNPGQEDEDEDGIGDACDSPDTDNDGIPDDIDNCPTVSNFDQLNNDTDQYGDACDNCDYVFNPDQADFNEDDIGDACDPDGDGILSDGDFSMVAGDNPCTGGNTVACDDNCPDDPNPDQIDTNMDGRGDVCDPCLGTTHDNDQDGYCSDIDNCPDDYNDDQFDDDGDSHGDVCDNCPMDYNPDQLNSDGDAWGDVCDRCPDDASDTQADTDGDGLGDACDPGMIQFYQDWPFAGLTPLTIQFINLSEPTDPGATLTYLWDFGDGETSTEENPAHTYTEPDCYIPILTASDGTHSDSWGGIPLCVHSGTNDFSWSGSYSSMVFESQIGQDINWSQIYEWDFGDGHSEVAYTNTINHSYLSPGQYAVSLSVRLESPPGYEIWANLTRFVYASSGGGTDLRAFFSASPTAGPIGTIVQFTDESEGSPTSWSWDFGDGTSSSEQHPQHQYLSAGYYTVTLAVSDGSGSNEYMRWAYIHIDEPTTDLEVGGFASQARRGFDYQYVLDLTNTGTTLAEECVLKFTLPTVIGVSFKNAYITHLGTGTDNGYTMSSGQLIFPLGTIEPTAFAGVVIVVNCHVSTAVSIGTVISAQLLVESVTEETNLDNNSIQITKTTVGSIDPNDKLASPEGDGGLHQIDNDQRLHYLIQFENKPEATADAIYVTVVDTLDPDFDWGTLAFGPTSHADVLSHYFDPYTGIVTWFFDSLWLPPNVTPPEGEGYVSYSIKPKADLDPGTELTNSAWIRFDFNEWLHAPENGEPLLRTIRLPSCCLPPIRGDVNYDAAPLVDIADLVWLVDYMFAGGPEPPCWDEGDVDGSGIAPIDITDLVYLVDYMFVGGPEPPACL